MTRSTVQNDNSLWTTRSIKEISDNFKKDSQTGLQKTMASLKEIKTRINSVNGTLKITSAMKLVASAKLHKAQNAIGNLVPYETEMHRILADLLSVCPTGKWSKYNENRPVGRTAIVAVSSDSALCGAFNSNVIKKFHELIDKYKAEGLENDAIKIYAVGRKIADHLRKSGFTGVEDRSILSGKPSYTGAAALADELAEMFLKGETDRVEIVYNHYQNTAVQFPTVKTYLPFSREESHDTGAAVTDYILEPDAESLMEELLPKVLKLKIYTVLLDASAAEHAARTIAMQTASDNGNKLLQELSLQYNKRRQQAITDELLDIVGGTMA